MKIKTIFQRPILILIMLTSLILVSCLKIKEDKIDGQWIRVKMWDIDPQYKEYWTFSDNVVTVEKEKDTLSADSVLTRIRVLYDDAEYSVSKTINHTYVQITGFTMDEYYTYNKKWQVIDLDKETFSLATSAGTGLIYLEFYND